MRATDPLDQRTRRGDGSGTDADAELDDEDGEETADVAAARAAGALVTVYRFLRPHYARYRSRVILLTLGTLIETGYNVAFPLSLKYLIDDALTGRNREALVWILAVLTVLAVTVSTVNFLYDYLNAQLGAAVCRDILQRLFTHLQALPIAYYARTEVGDVMSHFSTDMDEVEELVRYGISWGLLPFLELVVAIGLLFYLSWQLALAALLVLPLTLLGPRAFSPRAVRATYGAKRLAGQMLSVVQETVSSQAVVRAFGLQDVVVERFRQRTSRLARTLRQVTFLGALMERFVSTAVLVLHLLILGFGAWLVFHGHLTIGTLVTFESVFWELSYDLGYVTEFLSVLIETAGSIRHIEDFLNAQREATEAPDIIPLPPFAHEIVFDAVSFDYNSDTTQLRDLSLHIRRGARVAIVGPSGAGKSTALNLLLRLYEPTSGRITIDGYDLRHVSRASLRSQIGVVFQDSVLFNTTLRENIRLGSPQASDDDVAAAARAAEIHEFIDALPQGYDSVAGDRGARLSGGQRQRIAIARAMVRQPAILVLDEATAALDQETEAAITATLHRVAEGRTVIAVTHRLASVVDFDRIFVLERGRLVEAGTHAELLAHRGVYWRGWRKQTGHGRDDHAAESGAVGSTMR